MLVLKCRLEILSMNYYKNAHWGATVCAGSCDGFSTIQLAVGLTAIILPCAMILVR